MQTSTKSGRVTLVMNCLTAAVVLVEGGLALSGLGLLGEVEAPGALRLARHLVASLLILLAPGVIYSQLLLGLRRQAGGPEHPWALVLGLGFALNAIFYTATIRLLRLAGVEISPRSVLLAVGLATAVGLAALWVLRRRASGPVRPVEPVCVQADRSQLIAGLILIVVFAVVNHGEILRPSFRYFLHEDVHRFLTYRRDPALALELAQGFVPAGDGRWRLADSGGTLRVTGGTPRVTGGTLRVKGPRREERSFPLRLVVFGEAGMRLELRGKRLRQGVTIKSVADPYYAGGYGACPPHQSFLLSAQLPASETPVTYTLAPTGRAPPAPVYIEDYSNLARSGRHATFYRRNKVGQVPLIAEAFGLMDDSAKVGDLLLDHPDMLVGYLVHSVVNTLAGRTLLGFNVLFLCMALLTYLLCCQVVRALVSSPQTGWTGALVWLLPLLITLSVLMRSLTHYRDPFLPDLQFTVELLVAILLLRHRRPWLFVLATIPLALTRSTGIFAAAFVLLGAVLLELRWREALKIGITMGVVWIVLAPLLCLQKLLEGRVMAALTRFHDYASEFSAVGLGLGRSALDLIGALVIFTSGICLMVNLKDRSARALVVVALLYGLLLSFSHHQPYYRFLPLVYLCGIYAAVGLCNVVDPSRRRLLAVAFALVFVVTSALDLHFQFFLEGWRCCRGWQ